MLEERKKILQKQGYKIIGNHSAIKLCLWCKKSLKNIDICYKNKFYGINSWQCIQASITLDLCNLKCEWCWRDINTSLPKKNIFNDDPKFILDRFIEEQKKLIQGFKSIANKKRFNEALNPKHVTLSLTGEACLYPKLPSLIREINDRNMTSFLVTNGTIPIMIKKLKKHEPTQLYITLPSYNEESFIKFCKPSNKNLWKNILKSLTLLKNFERPTVRLTLAKQLNMLNPEDYAKLLRDIDFKFLELKAAMLVGYARYRMTFEQMPSHFEIIQFAKKIASLNKLKIIDEKENSRVVLLMKKDKDRMLKL